MIGWNARWWAKARTIILYDACRGDFAHPTRCFNIFMTVAYDADGKWEIRLPKGKPGDCMVMQALMPQIGDLELPDRVQRLQRLPLKPLTLEMLK